MQHGVLVRGAEQVAAIQHRAHPLEDLPQLDTSGSRARAARDEPRGPRAPRGLKDLHRLSFVDETDMRPAMRHVRNESLGLEPRERGAHGGPPDAERPREVSLNEALVGLQPSGHDRVANRVLGSLAADC